MKINIVTVYNSDNCGSFLQAWALWKHLSSAENDVSFCRFKRPTGVYFNRFSSCVKCLLKLRLKRAKSVFVKMSDFIRIRKQLKMSNADNSADLYIFGSDTLWNFDDNFFANNMDFFTGTNITKPCYTYSMSVASTSTENFCKNENGINNIKRFKAIAVRDEHSRNVISTVYPSENIVKTIDPTLLLSKEDYIKNFDSSEAVGGKYLAVYYFGDISEDIWKALKSFAQKKGLKIVNVGVYEEKYDKCVVNSPNNFIKAFANADYIFTNTFHGCVFSTIFNKQFATNGIHKKKIEGFLQEFSLLDRVMTQAEDIEKIFTTPVDYDNVNNSVNEARKKSEDYLQRVLNEVKGNE